MKLIDLDELLANVERDLQCSVEGEENAEAVRRMMQSVYDDVKDSPIVDLVMCGECIYRNKETKCCEIIAGAEVERRDEDYCSWGARNDDTD